MRTISATTTTTKVCKGTNERTNERIDECTANKSLEIFNLEYVYCIETFENVRKRTVYMHLHTVGFTEPKFKIQFKLCVSLGHRLWFRLDFVRFQFFQR